MKALSIVALVFAALSIFIPLGGIFIALGCSVLALITFCNQPTLSGITFGINIISTAFLSPSLSIASYSAGEQGASMYSFYVGFHIVAMLIAFVIFYILKKKKSV